MGDIRRRFMLPAKYNNYVIHYTSISNDVIEFKTDICDASIISNTYDAKNGGEVIFNNEITCINEEAFKDCNLLTSIKLPDTITEIGASAFHGCHRLKSVNIPSNVTHIREYAFYHCVQLDNVIIPEKCVSIGDSAFYDCWQLKTVKCEGDTAPYIGENVFSYEYLDKIYVKWSEDGFSSYYTILDAYNERVEPYYVNIDEHTKSIIFYKTNDELEISITNYQTINSCNGWFAAKCGDSDTITEIPDGAFKNADTLISIIIPDTITLIGDFAFFKCTSLASVNIPESVTEIGDSAFGYCKSLTSVTIPESVTEIGDSAFYGCTSLTSITIPDSVTLIRDYAFNGCTSLTHVTLPNNITRISVRLFSECELLTNVIIPNTVTLIDQYAFYGCTSLGKIIIPSNVTQINRCAFQGAWGIMFINGTPTLQASIFSSGKWAIFTHPDNVAYINNNAGADNSRGGWCYPLDYTHDIIYKSYNTISGEMNTSNNIVNDITLLSSASICKMTFNDTLTEIEDEMFSGITDLFEIVYMPDTITSIGNSAFLGCSNLKSIDGLNNITSIGSMAFRDCTSLSSITIPETVTSIGTYAFSGCSSLTNIPIPNSITSITDGAFHTCSSLTNIIIPNGVTTIGGSAFNGCVSLTHIIIPDNVTSIGEWAFTNTTNLKCIILPHKLSNISDYTFHGCTSMEHIIFNENVTSIGNYAFWECNNITSITIPDSVTSIGNGTFQECASLITVNTGNGNLNTVGSNVFARCNSLLSFTGKYASSDNKCFIVNNVLNSYATSQPNSTYTIPANITDIGAYAFSECNNLTNVTISNNVVRIWEGAFSYSSLVNVDIGNSVTTIDDDVFRESTKLQTVKLGNKVGWIGDSAFYGCSSLRKIISYAPTAPSISSTTFNNVKSGGLLCYPYGSNYNSWLSTSSYYLGYYNWNSEAMSNHPLEVVFIDNNGRVSRVSKYDYKSSMGQPIGIVVVPEGFAPDGEARMISLEPASTTSVTWQTSASDTALQNYPRVSITGNTDTTIKGNQVVGIFPSDAFSALQSFVDPKAYYSSSTNANRIPSPYYNDDANPNYYAIPYGASLNALSDFSGRENTLNLTPNRSIHPAINAIYSFNNAFRNKYGVAINWYLPSIGELGYVMARLKEIRNLMNELGASSTPLHSASTYLWSSTEATASAAWDIWLSNGGASGMYLKTNTTNFTIPWPMSHI